MRNPPVTVHAPSEHDVGNVLLNALSRADRKRILAQCDIVALVPDDTLTDADTAYRYAYFPSSGMISVSAQVSHHPELEIALVGRESMLGAPLALGERVSELRSVVLSAGWAWRISPGKFRAALEGSRTLRTLSYTAALQASALFAHATPCMRFHLLQERLALWLLQAGDRCKGEALTFTHQQLANTLGVQRSAVTLAAGKLQRLGYIRYVRGQVHITSREGLESAACECYARAWRV